MEKSNYKITFKKSAWKELANIPKVYIHNILKNVEQLKKEPRPRGCEKLIGKELYRVRVGIYRVVYGIDDENLIVDIIRVGHRKEVYR